MRKKANRVCDAYANESGEPCDDVTCTDCGARVVLCESALADGACPACNILKKEAQRIVAAELNTKDWGDELCEDERGEDPNGDGGFRTNDKIGKAPLDKNARDIELRNAEFEKEAAIEADYWKRAYAEERKSAARYAQAIKTSAKMWQAGLIKGASSDEAIDTRAQELLAEGLDVPAMKYLEEQVVLIAAQRDQERSRSVRASSRSEENQGLMTSIAMKQPTNSGTIDIVKELSNVFSRPRDEEWDERTGRKLF